MKKNGEKKKDPTTHQTKKKVQWRMKWKNKGTKLAELKDQRFV